jgi:hypothetical protein
LVAFAALASVLGQAARASDTSGPHPSQVRIAPAESGRVGVWLVVGPFRSATFAEVKKPAAPEALTEPPVGVDESQIVPRDGRPIDGAVPAPPDPAPIGPAPPPPPLWTLGATNEGGIDLQSLLHATEHDVIAYAAGTLHVRRAGRYYLLLGADDGIRVSVDGRPVFLRDEARPAREDDDMVPLDLTAGDHALLFKLHQRDGEWRFGVRIVDETLRAPTGAWLTLPGATASEARDLASKASWVSLDRGIGEDGYHPKLTVKFLDGVPRDVPLRVHAALVRAGREDERVLDVDAGQVPLDGPWGGELVVALPPLVGEDAAKLEDGDYIYEIDVAGRALKLPFFGRRATRDAIAHADRALTALAGDDSNPVPPPPPPGWLREGTLDSVANLRDRLLHLVDHGDVDGDAQRLEARELDAAATALDTTAFRSSDSTFRRATTRLPRSVGPSSSCSTV